MQAYRLPLSQLELCPRWPSDRRGFDKNDYPLLEIAVDTWDGFVFVHYGSDPQPLAEHLGNLAQTFAAHRCGDMRLAGSLEFEIAANWKLLAENALETRGNWTALLVEDETSVATLRGEDKPFNHIEGLGDAGRAGAYFTLVYPSTQLVFAQDCAWWLAFTPRAVDLTRLTIGACFPAETIARADFDDKVQAYFDRWRLATAEDNAICEAQQQGQAFDRRPGRYSADEFAVHAFDNWVLDQVLDR